jgi:hypothetical protein
MIPRKLYQLGKNGRRGIRDREAEYQALFVAWIPNFAICLLRLETMNGPMILRSGRFVGKRIRSRNAFALKIKLLSIWCVK